MKWSVIKMCTQGFFHRCYRWVDWLLSKPWRAFVVLYLFGILVVTMLHFSGTALIYLLKSL